MRREHYIVQVHRADPRFPIGRTRLETVGVVSCAVIMTLATIEACLEQFYDRLLPRCTYILLNGTSLQQMPN